MNHKHLELLNVFLLLNVVFDLKHRAILYNEAEVFSLSITNPNG